MVISWVIGELTVLFALKCGLKSTHLNATGCYQSTTWLNCGQDTKCSIRLFQLSLELHPFGSKYLSLHHLTCFYFYILILKEDLVE